MNELPTLPDLSNRSEMTVDEWWAAYKEFGESIQMNIEESGDDPELQRKYNDMYLRWLDMGAKATGVLKPGDTNVTVEKMLVMYNQKAMDSLEKL